MIKDLDINTLFNLFNDDSYILFFSCVIRGGVLYRYKLMPVKSLSDLNKFFEKNSLRRFESGINSDEICVFDADYIDCYKRYPI